MKNGKQLCAANPTNRQPEHGPSEGFTVFGFSRFFAIRICPSLALRNATPVLQIPSTDHFFSVSTSFTESLSVARVVEFGFTSPPLFCDGPNRSKINLSGATHWAHPVSSVAGLEDLPTTSSQTSFSWPSRSAA